jgi:8-oxo-dGTP pyrophosphatase MutT (NUDIX family)
MSTRRASTVLVVRDGANGMEVLMLRRVARAGDLHGGAHVFPGGTLDPADDEHGVWCAGLDDTRASERLGLPSGGLAHYVAAVRECFEECGVLLACDAALQPAGLDAHPPALLAELRSQLRAGRIGLRDVCERLDLRLTLDSLAYHSHWLTPLGLAKRFDTRFFVAAMPPLQTCAVDGEETLSHCWIRPAEALAAGDDMRLPFPTRRTLAAVAAHASAAQCLAATRALTEIACIVPRMAQGPDGVQPVHPDEAPYAEIGRLDPHGEGSASRVMVPGRAVRLAPGVLRVTAPNAGTAAGFGANTYLVGDAASNRWVVIDPGPAQPAHADAVVAAAPGPIHTIVDTHSHAGHSPGAALLQSRTGAAVVNMHAGHVLVGGDVILEWVHAQGQACCLLRGEKMLFTGGHAMQDSAAAGLHGAEWLAPGRGFLIGVLRRPAAARAAPLDRVGVRTPAC